MNSFNIQWNLNRLKCSGQLNRSFMVRRVSAGMYQIIEDRGFSDLTLDFTDCDAVTETVILPLLPIIEQYRTTDNIDFKLKLPQQDDLRRLFLNTGWAHFIEPS